jgi:dihydrolipoamide dehydrogenase
MAETYDYDLVVIGSGPGGYVAAIRATQLGMTAAVIEKDKPGGVCLNIGCIPSKALIHQAEVFRLSEELSSMGATIDYTGFNYKNVYKKSRVAAEKLSKGVQFLLKKNKVEYIEGTAKVSGPHEVTVDGSKKVTGKNILVATGSRPRSVPGFDFDEEKVLSSTGALMLQEIPGRMVILGAGYIGMEFAHVMSSFGVEVTVVEMLDRILPNSDAEVVDVLHKEFNRRGIKMLTSTKAKKLQKNKDGVVVTVEGSDGKTEDIKGDLLLVAVGRAPNTENLGLEALGIKLEKGYVRVGDYYQTDVSSVYAIGDVIPTLQLAHAAMAEGELVVEHMAGHHPEPRIDQDLIPAAIFTEPQLASFGPMEQELKDKGVAYEKATFPYRGAGKSVAIGRPEGMVKLLYAPDSHEILAAHLAGAEATELVHELLLAKKAELLPEDIATMVHAHPTLSEALMESARAAEGWVIHA